MPKPHNKSAQVMYINCRYLMCQRAGRPFLSRPSKCRQGKKKILEIIPIDPYQKISPWIFDQVNCCLLTEDITTACILLTKLQLTFYEPQACS